MLTLNLSTVSGNLLTTATIDRGVRRVCSICGGTAAECLCVTQNPVMADPKDIDDPTGKDDSSPLAHLERCLDVVMEDPGEVTVPQLTPIESIAEWIAWSQGQPIA